jgi:hypothetical protein
MALAAESTKQYPSDYNYDETVQQRIYSQPCQILVIDGDCLDVVMHFIDKYPQSKPVVLNMASKNNPGGGWKNGLSILIYFSYIELFYLILGAGAQEENLHRRTNMFQCLEDPYRELEGKRDWDYHVPEVCLKIFRLML